jgi:hypothetical protein
MELPATGSLPHLVLQYATGGPSVSDSVRKDFRTGWLFGLGALAISSIHSATSGSNTGWGRRLLYSLGAAVFGGLISHTRDMWSGFDSWARSGAQKAFDPLTDPSAIATWETRRAKASNYPEFSGKSDLAADLKVAPVEIQGDAPFMLIKNTKDFSFQSKDPKKLKVDFYRTTPGDDTIVCFTPGPGFEKTEIRDAIIATHNSAAKREAQRFEFAVTYKPGSTP